MVLMFDKSQKLVKVQRDSSGISIWVDEHFLSLKFFIQQHGDDIFGIVYYAKGSDAPCFKFEDIPKVILVSERKVTEVIFFTKRFQVGSLLVRQGIEEILFFLIFQEEVFTPLTFDKLFHELCLLAGIDCLVLDFFVLDAKFVKFF